MANQYEILKKNYHKLSDRLKAYVDLMEMPYYSEAIKSINSKMSETISQITADSNPVQKGRNVIYECCEDGIGWHTFTYNLDTKLVSRS